jgi:hypothetical protein
LRTANDASNEEVRALKRAVCVQPNARVLGRQQAGFSARWASSLAARWLAIAGHVGLLLLVDIVVTGNNCAEEPHFYTFVARWRTIQWTSRLTLLSADLIVLVALWEAPTLQIYVQLGP